MTNTDPSSPQEGEGAARLESLEAKVAALERQVKEPGPKPKDRWDKLSALSTLFSGVILGMIGVWVNHSLNSSQQQSQRAQSEATQGMERAHNQAVEKQSADALELQKQQFEYSKELEVVKERLQSQQARDTLTLQREQNRAALELQRNQNEATNNLNAARFAKELMPDMQANGQSREAALKLMERVNPLMSVQLAVTYSETSLDPNLKSAAAETIARLKTSPNAQISQLAGSAQQRIASSKRIRAIIQVFESGAVAPTYAEISSNADKLSYGSAYSNLGDGSLLSLLQEYTQRPEAKFSSQIQAYLPRVKSADPNLPNDDAFKALLRQAATDPAMQSLQDEQFDLKYWKPISQKAEALGLTLPLSLAVVYDSRFQGGAPLIEKATTEKLGGTPATGIDEKQWITTYVDLRIDYLSNFRIASVRSTAYRPEAFQQLIRQNRWDLKGDLVVRGVQIPE